jgi:hypothetical protein
VRGQGHHRSRWWGDQEANEKYQQELASVCQKSGRKESYQLFSTVDDDPVAFVGFEEVASQTDRFHSWNGGGTCAANRLKKKGYLGQDDKCAISKSQLVNHEGFLSLPQEAGLFHEYLGVLKVLGCGFPFFSSPTVPKQASLTWHNRWWSIWQLFQKDMCTWK